MARMSAALRARMMLALLPWLRRGSTVRLCDVAAALGTTPEMVAELLHDLVFCGVPPFSPDALIDLEVRSDEVKVVSGPPALDSSIRLTLAELRALLAAFETAGAAPDDPVVRKLAEAAADPPSIETLGRTLRARSHIGIADTYATLADAIETSRKVRISYASAGEPAPRERVVHPHALVNRAGAWYLSAFCESAQAGRTFRLDRIRDLEVLGEGFTAPSTPETRVVPEIADLPRAIVRIDAGYDLDGHDWPGAAVTQQPDGSLTVSVPYASLTWLAQEVCAGLGRIEVLDPPEARAAVRSYAERLLGDLSC